MHGENQNQEGIDSEEREWWLYTSEGTFGPYSRVELRGYHEQGLVTDDHYVFQRGWDDWELYGETDELALSQEQSDVESAIDLDAEPLRSPSRRKIYINNLVAASIVFACALTLYLSNHPFGQIVDQGFSATRELLYAGSPMVTVAPATVQEQGVNFSLPESTLKNRLEKFTLENGMTVLLRPVEEADSVGLALLYSIGGKHDPAGKSGLAHLAEHAYVTAAAGTVPARNHTAIRKRYLAGWDAQTGDDYTVFAAVFEKDLLWQELDETAERMSSLSFTDTIVEREKSRVIAEVRNMFTGNPRLAAMNNARERAMPSHSAGRKGGHPDEIRNLKIGDIETHWKNYYKPENAVLVVAGGFDAFDAKVKINDLFSDIEPGEDVPDASQFGPVSKGRYKRVRVSPQLPGTSSHVCLAYRAPTMDDELYAPFLVLTVRMWLLAARIQFDPSQFPPPVYYAPLDDPDVFYVNTPVGIYESRQAAVRRIEAFVNESMSAELEPGDVMTTMDFFGPFLGFADLPEEMLAQNLYGLTFSLGRSEQLGLEPDKLRDAIENVTDRDLRRAATKTFSTDNRAAVIATVSKGRL